MCDVWTMGEMLVEIMRPRPAMGLRRCGEFLGPFPSGAPAIFIDAVARLGHSAGIIGGVGRDDFGACLLERLQKDGVDVRFVSRPRRGATAVAFVAYAEDGSRTFIFHIDGTPAAAPGQYEGAVTTGAKFFHVMGCSLMTNESFQEQILGAVEQFAGNGARISFDPNIRPELLGGRSLTEVVEPVLRRTSVLLPGESELQLLTGASNSSEPVKALFERYPLEVVVVKRGRRGAVIHTPDDQIPIEPYAVQEVDPTGSGDCFDAGFLTGLLEHKPLDECGRIAAAAGALNAAAFGPMEGDISPESIQRLMTENT